MIEVHPNPSKALSDGPQSLTLEQYSQLMQQMSVVGQAVDRWSAIPSLSTAKSNALQAREPHYSLPLTI